MTARVRGGFTLWEMALVLAVLGVTLLLAAPALGSFGLKKPQGDAQPLLELLRMARGEAVFASAVVAVRLDPASGAFRMDTTGVNGMGHTRPARSTSVARRCSSRNSTDCSSCSSRPARRSRTLWACAAPAVTRW